MRDYTGNPGITGVVTWQSPRGERIDICRMCEHRLTRQGWPKDATGEQYAQVYMGQHKGMCEAPGHSEQQRQRTETRRQRRAEAEAEAEYPVAVARTVSALRPDLTSDDAVATVLTDDPTLTAEEVIEILDEATAEWQREREYQEGE
jgi:hypothetical protein